MNDRMEISPITQMINLNIAGTAYIIRLRPEGEVFDVLKVGRKWLLLKDQANREFWLNVKRTKHISIIITDQSE